MTRDLQVDLVFSHNLARYVATGVDPKGAQRLIACIERWEDCCGRWSEEATRHEALAKEAADKGRTVSAAEAAVGWKTGMTIPPQFTVGWQRAKKALGSAKEARKSADEAATRGERAGRSALGSGYVAISAILVLLVLTGCKKENAYVPPPPAEVGVMHPITRTFAPYIDSTGTVVAYNQVTVEARVQGFVQQISYQDGEQVKAGQLLFLIEPAPYEAQLNQVQGNLAGDQAQYVYAGLEYDRQLALIKDNHLAASQSQADQWRSNRDTAKGRVQSDQAAVANASINLSYTRVTAPFDGVVTNHQVSLGKLVGNGSATALANVVQLDPIYVTFNAPDQRVQEFHLALAKKGLTAISPSAVTVRIGLPTQSGFPYEGRLDYVSPMADATTGTVMARVVVDNPRHDLLPNYLVHVRAFAQVLAAPMLFVPNVALGTDQQGRYVLVTDKNNVVEQKHVETGQEDGALSVISSGLEPDDNIIVTGLDRAIPGNKVAPRPAPPPAS
jgi:RND family efflux transporter MFP subunit